MDNDAKNKTMTDRERALAVLRYQPYDRLPIVHFGFLSETRERWMKQGLISKDEFMKGSDATPEEHRLTERLGFDFNWQTMFHSNMLLMPGFKEEVVATFPDGTRHVRNGQGVTRVDMPGAGSIHAEIDHLLKDRQSWEAYFKPRMQWTPERVRSATVRTDEGPRKFDEGGLDYLKASAWSKPLGLHCGSLYGAFRNLVGVENTSYMLVDDEALFTEILDTLADLSYRNVDYILATGAQFDFAHFWEDICFKNGPLVNPEVFAAKVGPHYRRITQLVNRHGLDIVSLDCDGLIDALVPVWFENGVNTMFPIEVGTWNASVAPWRQRYGRGLRGVGGMNKRVFSRDRAAVDAEIERLRPLVELGGYIPCPDHRLPGDCKFDLVCYYAERMRAVFG